MKIQVGGIQYYALLHVQADDGLSRPELVDYLGYRSSPSVTMAAARGWIEVEGRGAKSHVRLTPLGYAILDAFMQKHGGWPGHSVSRSVYIELSG